MNVNLQITLLLINALSTTFMTGLIWFVQIVHYPLFDGVGMDEFRAYAERHRELTTMVVAPPMLTEIATSVILPLIWDRPHQWLLWINFLLVVIIWISTASCSIPCHGKLCSVGYTPNVHHWLVLSNWLRTVLWTTRALVLTYVMYCSMTSTRAS